MQRTNLVQREPAPTCSPGMAAKKGWWGALPTTLGLTLLTERVSLSNIWIKSFWLPLNHSFCCNHDHAMPESDEDNDTVRIWQKKVGSIVVTHGGCFSSMILSPICSGCHSGFSMKDPKTMEFWRLWYSSTKQELAREKWQYFWISWHHPYWRPLVWCRWQQCEGPLQKVPSKFNSSLHCWVYIYA